MRHDERASDIEKILYDSLQPPSQEAVREDCDRVLTRLRDAAPSSTYCGGSAPAHTPSAVAWRRLAFVPAAAVVLLAVFIGFRWPRQETLRIPVQNDNALMMLSDGSQVERRAGADVVVESASDGLLLRLRSGSIIVHAAKQTAGHHLYVKTKDITVSVVGTIFLVKADEAGSHVAVIEGEVRVRQNGTEKSLHSGEQTSSNEKLQTLALQAEIGWSREASAYLAMLHQALAQSVARQTTPRGAVSSKPQFEVASVRPCEEDFKTPLGMRGGGSSSMRVSRGRVDLLCVTALTLIRNAYRELENNYTGPGPKDRRQFDITYGLGVEDGARVRGGPDWVRSEKYTITAVAQGPMDAATLAGPMLLDLLERRFQLKLHVESEEIPMWGLGIAKGGLKIKPKEPGSCVVRSASVDPFDQEAWRRYVESLTKPLCGSRSVGGSQDPRISSIVAVGQNMKQLADDLSLEAWKDGEFYWPLAATLGNQRVIDKTGIPQTTLFDFMIEYGSDPEHYSFFGLQANPDPQPTIFQALEKLGLTLEKIKGPREFIVIDHIERPLPN